MPRQHTPCNKADDEELMAFMQQGGHGIGEDDDDDDDDDYDPEDDR